VGEAVALNEEMGAYGEVTLSLQILSYAAESRGDLERAAALLEDSIALAREHDILWILVSGLLNLGSLRFDQGALDSAADLVREALSIAPELGHDLAIVEGLGLASAIAVTAGDDETGGRLWGAVERPYEEFGHSYLWDDMERFRQMLAERGEAFEDARRRGRLLTLEEGIAVALGESA
jgi:tetratricopeptide (TPR) repeat protein